MKFCSDGCIDACDFCIHYDFNGDENGAYTGDGYCNLHKENYEPYESCEEFHCRRVEE